ncbi:DUF4118 domain-containing protein [Ensifer sp. BR816]|uniref:DUF4118 domain-containing protein n=1 Tax=Rhizobium sp. (strain BR816) TaxID=1057002 RepID=UPI000399B859|nr:DUF4118 domain-containing protein [Ensifer sp. BR816]
MVDAKLNLRRDFLPMANADPLSSSAPSDSPAVVGYLASLAMTVLATIVAVGVDNSVKIPNLSLVFVVPVVIAAVGFGLGPSLCAALLGALSYNFFLTEPRYSLLVDDPANIWAIALLFVVGLVVSYVAFTSERRATDAALLRRQATALQKFSRDVVAATDVEAIVSIATQALAALFKVPVVVMLVDRDEVVSVGRAGGMEPQEQEYEAARSSLETGAIARAGVYPADASRFDFWPVKTTGHGAVIGLAFDPDDRPSAPDTLVDIVGSILALALDRQHFPVDHGARSVR